MGQFRNLSGTTEVTPGSSGILADDKVIDQNVDQNPNQNHDPYEVPLTTKEDQILSQIAEGKTNKQIAAEIHLAEGTVKNYVSRIMAKLHAQSRTELAVRAVNRRR